MLQIPHCRSTRRITVSLMFCERCMYLEYQLHSTMRNHHPQELRGEVPIEMQIYSNEGAWDPFTVCSLGHRISAIHGWLTFFGSMGYIPDIKSKDRFMEQWFISWRIPRYLTGMPPRFMLFDALSHVVTFLCAHLIPLHFLSFNTE